MLKQHKLGNESSLSNSHNEVSACRKTTLEEARDAKEKVRSILEKFNPKQVNGVGIASDDNGFTVKINLSRNLSRNVSRKIHEQISEQVPGVRVVEDVSGKAVPFWAWFKNLGII